MVMVYDSQRIALAAEVILQTTLHNRTASGKAGRHDLTCRQPVSGNNRCVQLAVWKVTQRFGSKAMTDVSHAVWGRVVVQPEQMRQFYIPPGLFQRFAYCSCEQGFAFIEMPGWLVEHEGVAVAFFHQGARSRYPSGTRRPSIRGKVL